MNIVDNCYVPLPKRDLIKLQVLIRDLMCHLHQIKNYSNLNVSRLGLLEIQQFIECQDEMAEKIYHFYDRFDIAIKTWDCVTSSRSPSHE